MAKRCRTAIWVTGVLLIAIVARRAWFLRDDWAFLLTRDKMRVVGGVDDMLFAPQDGHWMTFPLIVFRIIRMFFGVDAYWPYVAVLVLSHLAIVALVAAWMRRLGVSAWTSTLLTGVLLVFGAGWENVLFAVQITYNFSLLAFLAHLLLVDHDGPVDRRDGFGVAISLIGVASSGFGPFFGFGVALLLVIRRRWRACAVAVVPQALAWLWWWWAWGADPAGDAGNASARFVGRFVEFGVSSTFGSIMGNGRLAWPAFIACLAVVAWPKLDASRRGPVVALMATMLVMYAGIGARRELFGVAAAGWSRYVYMAAMLAAPVLAIGLDQARRFAPWAPWLVRAVVCVALLRNAVWLVDNGDAWADTGQAQKSLYELVAGSDLTGVDPTRSITEFDPDVHVGDLGKLITEGAIHPRVPATDDERARVAFVLGG